MTLLMAQTAKPRIQHLARYFGGLSLLCLFGYAFTPLSHLFLFFVAPALFLTSFLRTYGGFLVGVIPDQPFFNNLFLLFPLTFIYFGLVGFQLKNILNESGKIRVVVLILFAAFLIYIHLFTFNELSLYWEGSTRFTR